mgnify:CR=1 FL=1
MPQRGFYAVIGRSGIERQALPVNIGLWPVHISAVFLGVILLMQERRSGKKLKAKLPRFKRNNKNVNKPSEEEQSRGQL